MIHKNNIVQRNVLQYVLFDEINTEDRIFVSWKLFEESMSYIHSKINDVIKNQNREFINIYALPRGGLCLGVKLSYLSGLPLITRKEDITDKTIVIDDCTDTGKTMSNFKDNFTVVMFHKPTSIFTPDIYFQETSSQINFCWESIEERN